MLCYLNQKEFEGGNALFQIVLYLTQMHVIYYSPFHTKAELETLANSVDPDRMAE